MNYAILPLRRYFELRGRSRRREFWSFSLLLFVVQAALMVLFGITDTGTAGGAHWWMRQSSGVGGLLGNVIGLLTFIPSLTVTARRLHDIDRTGWWILLYFLPIVGWLMLLIFLCLDGTVGSNRYGSDPKARGLGDIFR